jgi:ABC-type sugar transport system ATPase subunit
MDIKSMSEIMIDAKGIGKEFMGVWVLHDMDFDLKKGEIHALVGENGAGKSTFIKILSGIYGQSAGDLFIDDQPAQLKSVAESEQWGIRTVHQEINLVPYFRVFENIFIGSEITKKVAGVEVTDDVKMKERAKEVLGMLNIDIDVNMTTSSFNTTMHKIIEICKVLIYDPKVIIFDEPTTSLGEFERRKLLEVIKRLKERGLSIIYVSHNLEEIVELADRVTVLRNGEKVETFQRQGLSVDKIISAMIGEKEYFSFKRDCAKPKCDQVSLELCSVTTDKLHDVNLKIYKGEILGIAGVVGAGKSEIARAIFGIDRLLSGRILKDGKTFCPSPDFSVKNGIALVPEERQLQGLIPNFAVSYNVTLTYMNKWANHGVINHRAEVESAQTYIDKLEIKTQGHQQLIKYLSGGNQQKAILSRWLIGEFEIGLFDEPTKGIDIKAKEDIYRLMNDLAENDKAVVMVSSYLPELLVNCDRIVVLREGRVVGEFTNNGQDIEEKITKVMLGGKINE